MPHDSAGDAAAIPRRAAKELLRDCERGDPAALARFRAVWESKPPSLQRCQHVIAQEGDQTSWHEVVHAAQPAGSRVTADWFIRRGMGAPSSVVLHGIQEQLNSGAYPSIDALLWSSPPPGFITWWCDHHPARGDAPKAGQHPIPIALPLGRGAWIGGACTSWDIRCMGIEESSEEFWPLTCAAVLSNTWESLAATGEWPSLESLMSAAGTSLMEKRGLEHTAQQLVHWATDIAQRPLAVSWSSAVQAQWGKHRRARSFLITGGAGRGKTFWLQRFIDHVAGSAPVVAFDLIGDLRGDRQPIEAWSRLAAEPPTAPVLVIDRPDGSSLPPMPLMGGPRCIVLNGVLPTDWRMITEWLAAQDRDPQLLLVVSGQVFPDRDVPTSPWSDQIHFRGSLMQQDRRLEGMLHRLPLGSAIWTSNKPGQVYRIDPEG